MSTRKICPHYIKDKKCSYEEYCIEQLLSDEKVCTSKIYYAMSLEQQLDQLKEENGYLKHKVSQYENLLKLDFTKCRTAEEEVEHANYLREQGAVVLTEENQNLKQTLTEIKEIVFPKNQLIITDSPIILKIQEKISEVEDANIQF